MRVFSFKFTDQVMVAAPNAEAAREALLDEIGGYFALVALRSFEKCDEITWTNLDDPQDLGEGPIKFGDVEITAYKLADVVAFDSDDKEAAY